MVKLHSQVEGYMIWGIVLIYCSCIMGQSRVNNDFGRGHARDLQASKAALAELLEAGQWRSAAFEHYIDFREFEKDAFV